MDFIMELHHTIKCCRDEIKKELFAFFYKNKTKTFLYPTVCMSLILLLHSGRGSLKDRWIALWAVFF